MKKELAPTANNTRNGVIDDHGFAAILESDDLGRELAGIIGGPRVNPTGSGLWIEDSFPALIDQITIALLEDFVRREELGQPVARLGGIAPGAAASEAISRSARAPNGRASRVLCNIA